MNIYGYCRISTAKQSIDRQIRNIKAEYPTAHIVQEAYTGTSIFRPEWLKLYRVLKSGDTVVFDSVSRMSRNAEEGFALYEDLYHKDIRLVFLKEHHIDTETYKKALSGSIAMTGTNVDFILKGINEYLIRSAIIFNVATKGFSSLENEITLCFAKSFQCLNCLLWLNSIN